MILVTGPTGHIGNVLVRELVRSGCHVRALVLPGEDLTPLQGIDVECVAGNVLDIPSLLKALRGVDILYHLAGLISILPGKHPDMERVNVEGTKNLLLAARQAGVQRLVYTSSIHALARAPHGVVVDEKLPYDVNNPYGAYDRSKALASRMVQNAAIQGMDAVIACPTGVIGPYDFRLSELGSLIYSCTRGRPQVYVDGAYDFVDVRDVANGLILACERGQRGENYILSGERITVAGFLESIQAALGCRLVQIRLPTLLARFGAWFAPFYYRLAEIRPRFTSYSLDVLASNSYISSEKARRQLGYSHRSVQQSLHDTVHWFIENPKLQML